MKWFKYIGIFMLFIAAAFFGMIWLAPSEVSFQVNEDFNAPIEEVFDATTNHQKLPKWIAGVESSKQVKGDGAAVGSEYDLYYKGKGNMILNHKVNQIKTNSTYAYTGTVKEFFEVISSSTYEAVDSNLTRVKTKITLKPLSSKFNLFMYQKETHIKNAAHNYTQLKEYLEK